MCICIKITIIIIIIIIMLYIISPDRAAPTGPPRLAPPLCARLLRAGERLPWEMLVRVTKGVPRKGVGASVT